MTLGAFWMLLAVDFSECIIWFWLVTQLVFTCLMSAVETPVQGVKSVLTLLAPTPQNSQPQSKNSSAAADELFECVWPFNAVGS